MRSKNLPLLCFFCSSLSIVPLLGWAGESSLPGVNVGELATVQSETILYKAQAERAKALRSIDGEASQTTTQPSAAYLPPGIFPPTTSAPTRTAGTQQDLPVVKAIFGSAKRLRATLLYSGGFEVDADSSSRELPGGYRVAILTVDNVTLERSGKRFPLGFSNIAPTNLSNTNDSAPNSPPSAPMLPGLIPGQP